jgi:hypothetical protein
MVTGNHHPAKRLTDPYGDRRVWIDAGIAPLIKTLWAAGYATIGSCQDTGDSLAAYAARGSGYWKPGLTRHAAHWKGYVLLEMPAEDACRLLDTISGTSQFGDRMHWAAPGGWEVACPVAMPDEEEWAGVLDWVQIRFPNDQVDELIKVLTDG